MVPVLHGQQDVAIPCNIRHFLGGLKMLTYPMQFSQRKYYTIIFYTGCHSCTSLVMLLIYENVVDVIDNVIAVVNNVMHRNDLY